MEKEITIKQAVSDFLNEKKYGKWSLRAVLFDMDGVLFDSMKNHSLAWYKTMISLGIPCEQEEFYQYEGATSKETIDIVFKRVYGREATIAEGEEVYKLKTQYFNTLPQAVPMSGARELLCQVQAAGLVPVLVTGSGQRSLLDRLEREFPGIFTSKTMVTAFDVKKGKPDPEPYRKGLEKIGAYPWEAIVVENAPLGVRAGVAAGIFTVAVNTGPLSDRSLWEAGANLVFSDLSSFSSNGFSEILKLW